VNLYFAGGYQNNSGIDIFHEKEPTSIGLISMSRIRKMLLEDTKGLHEEGHHEAPLGGADRPQPYANRPLAAAPRLLSLQAISTASKDAS
jgi:hypothetical protein